MAPRDLREDVIDTGLTLLLQNLPRQPSAWKCACFQQAGSRLIEIPLRYKGFDLPDRFVVGYGLDYRENIAIYCFSVC
jgi:hypoxanthine phosphoribosyltransferase